MWDCSCACPYVWWTSPLISGPVEKKCFRPFFDQMVTNTDVCTYEHSHTHFMTPMRRTIYGQKVKKDCVCILPVCPLCHLALCEKFHHVSAIPPICESVWVCMWMWDKVCKCIQAFPAASAAVIWYWFIVTVAMATPDWNTNPTETVRTWNHIALPSDDWQALSRESWHGTRPDNGG